jgi:hypothetical protein
LGVRIGRVSLSHRFLVTLWGSAFAAAALGFGVKRLMGTAHPWPLAAAALGVYGIVYFAGTYLFGIDGARSTITRLLKRGK